MMNIRLCKMTKDLCRQYHKQFSYDPDIFVDMSKFTTCVYHPEQADAHWQRQHDLGREHLAIIMDDTVIGEIVTKNIDRSQKCCTFGDPYGKRFR